MKSRYIGVCFGVFILLASCQQEIDWGIITVTANDYQPVSANSQWAYTSTSSGNFTVKSIGTDSIISGRNYYKFDRTGSGATSRYYVNKTGNVYRQYALFPLASQVIDLLYLKDTSVGTTWTNTITASGFSSYHKYTVAARGLQRVVNGTAFNNVIELNYQFSFDNPFGTGAINAGGGKNYYAKGLGAIESFYTIGYFGVNISDTTKLTSYTIY